MFTIKNTPPRERHAAASPLPARTALDMPDPHDAPTLHQRIAVPFAYPVRFTRNVFDPANPALAESLGQPADGPPKTLAFLDAGLVAAQPHLPESLAAYAAARADVMSLVAEPRVLPGGEQAKDGWGVTHQVLDDLAAHHLCRHSIVLAAGGGAMLDAVGFAAALFHRGCRLVRLPSTTLSQGDSGVGVKNGINLGGVKNLLGTFAPPFAVVNDLALLATLPHDVMLDGIAEAFKVAIVKDREFFDTLARSAARIADDDPATIHDAVQRSAAIHLGHIRDGQDPFEMGAARPLDFGHWAGHRLEGLSGYAIRHGQGVAIGIALDTCYACLKGLLAPHERDAILDAFRRCGLPVYHPLLSERDAAGRLVVLEGLQQFREHLGGRLCITLPQGIGSRLEVHDMDTALIEQAIRSLSG